MSQVVPNLPGEFLGSDTLGIAGEFGSRRTAERMFFSMFPRQSHWRMAMGYKSMTATGSGPEPPPNRLWKPSTRTDINSHDCVALGYLLESELRFNLGLVKAFEAEVNFSCMRHHRSDLCIFHDSGLGPGGRRFKSFRPDHSQKIQTGHMGDSPYRLHR